MTLREPPRIDGGRKGFLYRLSYVPLILLLLCGIAAGGIGWWAQGRQDVEPSPTPDPTLPLPSDPAPITPAPGVVTPSSTLTSSCRPPAPQPSSQPWLNDARAAESVWQQHSADMSGPAVTGEDGWVFWGDVQAQNFSQALGRRLLSEAEVAGWTSYLSAVRDALGQRGIPFVVVIAPAKWSIYPQELPSWGQSIRGSGPLDQLMAAAGELPVVDLRATELAAAQQQAVFSRVNSHWTEYGAYVGWKQIAGCLNDLYPTLGLRMPVPISGVRVEQANNEFAPFGVPDPAAPDWAVPEYADPLSAVRVTDASGVTTEVAGDQPTDMSQLPVTTHTDQPQTDKTALLLRDSFGNALSIPVQQAFATTWQVRHNVDTPGSVPDIAALADEYHPDVVILEIAQRHLTFPAPKVP